MRHLPVEERRDAEVALRRVALSTYLRVADIFDVLAGVTTELLPPTEFCSFDPNYNSSCGH